MNIRVMIFGLGRIAWKNDFLSTSKNSKLTHYSNLKDRVLVAEIIGIDKDVSTVREFENNTGSQGYANLELVKEQIEFVVISTTTECHYETIKEIIQIAKPKFLVCEKPLGKNSQESKSIAEMCSQRDIKLFVPYFRRYMPAFKELKTIINNKIYGNVEEVIVEYGQDLRRNGCHFLNLADYLLSELDVNTITIIENSTSNPSWTMRDKNGAVIKFIGLSTTPRIGEVKIVMQRGLIQVSNGGSTIEHGDIDENSGWLTNSRNLIISDWRTGMSDFYNCVFNSIKNPSNATEVDIESAIRTQQIMDVVLRGQNV